MTSSSQQDSGRAASAPRHPYPPGMVVLLCWFAYSALFALYKCLSPGAVVLASHLTGSTAVAFHAFCLIVPAAAFWGILQRRQWGSTLGIVWQSFGVLLSAINYCWFFFYPAETLAAYKSLAGEHSATVTMTIVHGSVLASLIFSVVVAVLVIWYLLKRREFFA